MKKLFLLQLIEQIRLWWTLKGKYEFAEAYRQYVRNK